MTLCLYAGPVAWIMLFLIRQWTFLRVGWIASLLVVSMLGFTCQAVSTPLYRACPVGDEIKYV